MPEHNASTLSADHAEPPLLSQEGASKMPSFLERTLGDCSRNISRHSKASFKELIATIVFLSILGLLVYGLAKVQGAQFDAKRIELGVTMAQLGKDIQESRSSVGWAQSSIERRQSELTRVSAPSAAPGQPPTTVPPHDQSGSLGKSSSTSGNKDTGALTGIVVKEDAELGNYQRMLTNANDNLKQLNEQLAKDQTTMGELNSQPVVSNFLLYGTGAIFVVVFGVFVNLYRLHLREIAKNEFYTLAILRIGIAAANSSVAGFDETVRQSLVSGAFDMPTESSLLRRDRRIESPLPGHPSSDLLASLLNRVLEQIDVVLKPKDAH
jgi:hypothetical protein